MIELTVEYSLKDLLKLNFLLTYKQPLMIILFLIGLSYIASYILFSIDSTIIKLTKPIENILIGISFTFLLPLSILLRLIKIFKRDIRFRESIYWSISENELCRKSNSLETIFDWTSILNIRKLYKWIIITYKDNMVLYYIPKKSFKTEYDYRLFWEYAKKNKVPIK